ncbi:hypothetical protein ACSSZE_03265 [Acidithiobacillus caldus]
MAEQLVTPEVGQVITDPAQFIRAGQFLNDVRVANLPDDFQAKTLVNAQVIRDGSLIYTNDFQPGDLFQGWSSGLVVSHKDDSLAKEAGLAGTLRHPLSDSLESALDQAHVLGPVSLDRDQRDSLFLSMKSQAWSGASDYLKPMENWAMGEGLSVKEVMQEQAGKVVPAETPAPSVPDTPPLPSPMGGLDMTGMAEGATLLYSRADAPDTLRTGVLMHNQDTTNGQRLEILNDQGLRERLYTGADQGHEGPENRLAAVVGYAIPTNEPIFVAGVGEDGKLNDKDPQSFGVFRHDEEGNAVPVGQAVSRELAENLKSQVEENRIPQPVEAPKTLSNLSELRDLLDLPPTQSEEAKLEGKPSQEEPKPQEEKQQPKTDDPKDKNETQQQQTVHQHIGLLSLLLMHTANAGRSLAKAIKGPDADEWQHRAHAHMDRAQKHLDAIANHPAVQEYQKMEALPNMPEQAKALYAETLLRNNPELAAHYKKASYNVEKSQDAMFQMTRKNGQTDPELLEKASKIHRTAQKLPDMENGSSGSGLFAALKSFFSMSQQNPSLRVGK